VGFAVYKLIAIYSVGLRGDVRSEWDETKQHDVVFLLTVQPPDQVALGAMRDRGEEPTPAQQHGLIYVRGAEVIEVGQEAQYRRQYCKRRESLEGAM
jgi:intron-binding protein aquarius